MNYTTNDYLEQLQQDREDLLDNLETKGITGLTGDETITQLVPKVLNIITTPNLQSKSVTINSNGTQTISHDSNYDGLDNVEVTTNVLPNLQSKSVTISSNTTTTIQKDSGYDGLNSVEVTTNVLPNLQNKEITITSNGTQTVNCDSNYDGLSSVEVTTNVTNDDVWTRPSDWWDTKTILQNAQVRDGLYPAYIVLIPNIERTTTFTKSTSNKALQFDGVLTSDGAWYTADGSTHTWDTSQDKPCSLGYKTRYAIIYVANKTITNNIDLKNFLCLEFISLDSEISFRSVIFGFNSEYGSNNNIMNIEIKGNFTYMPDYLYAKCGALKKVKLDKVSTLGFSAFYGCYALEKVEMPSLTTLNGNSIFAECKNLRSVYFPLLTTLTGSSVFSGCQHLKSISFPLLTSQINYGCFSSCIALESVSLPLVTQLGNSVFYGDVNLKNVSLPLVEETGQQIFYNCYSLENISLPSLSILGNNAFYNCYLLRQFAFENPVQITNGNTIFVSCFNLYDVEVYNDFDVNNLSLASSPLTYESIINIFSKLKDVTGESGTYTMVLGATNLAKISSAELAVATNKGWTIS